MEEIATIVWIIICAAGLTLGAFGVLYGLFITGAMIKGAFDE